MFRLPLERLEQLYLRAFDSEFLRRIVRNSGYLVSATVISAGFGMVQNVFQARALEPAGLGLLAVMASFTNVLNRFTAFRIDELVVKFVRLYEERKQRDRAAAVYKLAALFEVLGALAAFLLIVWLAPLGVRYLSDQPGVESLFILYGTLVLINMVFDSSDGILQVFNKFNVKSIIDISQSLVRLVLTILVFIAHGGLMGMILAELAGRMVRSAAIVLMALRTAQREWGAGWWRTPLSVLKSDRRSLYTFAFSTNASATISLVAKDSEDLWVNAFLGNAVGGIYAIARTLIGFLQIPISPLPSTTYPELSRAVAQNDWKNVRGVLQRGSLLALIYSLPVTLFLIVFGRQVILLFGEKYLPAYLPLVILLIGFGFTNIFYWNRAALLALNRPVYPTIINFIGMILKVTGIFLFAGFGAVAFAALLAGYYIFTVGLAAIKVQRDVRARLASVPA
jgi:O-antigen/teichoic acid export membrane protein